MPVQALFGLSVLLSFVAFGIIAKLYIVPKLRAKHRQDAVLPLVVLHTFRFVGLSFLVPGVVSPSLSPAFAAPAAYGDLIATRFSLGLTGRLPLSGCSTHGVLAIFCMRSMPVLSVLAAIPVSSVRRSSFQRLSYRFFS